MLKVENTGAAHPDGQHAEQEIPMSKIVHLPVAKIATDGLQTRAVVDPEIVREYNEAVQGGAKFPPITVFQDPAGVCWLADGFHRVAVARQLGQKRIMADVHEGIWVDALRFALRANGAHGVRRTNADKAYAVKVAYDHRAVLGLPDVPAAKMIADLVGIDPGMAGRQLALNVPWAAALARTGADGKTYALPPVPTRQKTEAESVVGSAEVLPPVPVRTTPEAEVDGVSGENLDMSQFPPPPVRRSGSQAGGQSEAVNSERSTVNSETEDLGPVDCRNRHIPEDLIAIWNRRQEVQDLATAISRVRVALEKAHKGKDPLWWELSYQAVKAQLDQAFYSVSSAQPWCVCPMCQGIGCRACSSRGLMSEYRFKQVVPKNMRK
jgi:hypothetical protein